MPLPFSPRVVYGSGPTTFNFSLPSTFWTPVPEPVGKARRATSGATETFLRSHFHLVEVTIRFTEAELSDVYAFIRWCHENGMGTFTWRFDQNDAGSAHTMYLEEPAPDARWRPDRDDEDPSMLTLPLVMRRSTDALIDVPAF